MISIKLRADSDWEFNLFINIFSFVIFHYVFHISYSCSTIHTTVCMYFSHHLITGYITTAGPVNGLTSSQVWCRQAPEVEMAFQDFKRRFTKLYPHPPRPSSQFVVKTDASDVAEEDVLP